MTTDELFEALARLRVETGSLACLGCGHEHNCGIRGCKILREAAEHIKTLEAERDALLEIAKKGKDCDTCANSAVCVKPGTDVAHWCDRCAAKCRCYGCGGDRWEWRGLPEAPAEGEKA